MTRIHEVRKALAGLLIPGLTVLGSAVLDGSDGGSRVTASEWIAATIASLGTGAVVYSVRNASDEPPRPNRLKGGNY